jgi:hypothetical protein
MLGRWMGEWRYSIWEWAYVQHIPIYGLKLWKKSSDLCVYKCSINVPVRVTFYCNVVVTSMLYFSIVMCFYALSSSSSSSLLCFYIGICYFFYASLKTHWKWLYINSINECDVTLWQSVLKGKPCWGFFHGIAFLGRDRYTPTTLF